MNKWGITLSQDTAGQDQTAALSASQIWQGYLQRYWMIAVAAVAVAAVIIIVMVHRRRLSNARKDLDAVQARLNSLKSIPLPYKLSKAVALARTKQDIGETVNQCQGDFDTIQVNLKKMQDMIADGEELVMLGKLASEKQNISDIGKIQDETDVLIKALVGKLDTILQKETAERDKVNDLKESFRNLKIKINASAANYVYCWEALERMITDIEHEFSHFEELMYASEFDKASDKMMEIKDRIDQLNEVVEKIPELITVAKGDLPVLVDDVNNNYAMVAKKGAYLDHLDVPKNLQIVNDTLATDLQKIKNGEVKEVNEHLLDCETRLNQLNQQIAKESDSYDQLVALRKATDDDMARLTRQLGEVTAQYDKKSEHYGFESWQQRLQQAGERQKALAQTHQQLTATLDAAGVPSSTVLMSLQALDKDILSCFNDVSAMSSALEGASYDEQRAHQQLAKLDIVVSEVQAKIRLNRLPAISQQYDADLVKADDYISRLEIVLAQTPLNVSLLNSLLAMAIDFIYKLYESVNRILGTAIMVENAIVIGNRYRSSYPDIDSELTRAELAYRNGEYTQALSIALRAIEKVHPNSVTKLLKARGQSQAAA